MMTEEGINLNQVDVSQLDMGESLSAAGKKKQPKRVLHFSDGTLEEYSTDEEDGSAQEPEKQDLVDPSTLPWGPWLAHRAYSSGSTALAACDYVGENIAYYLGITSPKYQYEIEEHQRAIEEEEEVRKEAAEAMVGWATSGSAPPSVAEPSAPVQGQAYILNDGGSTNDSFINDGADGATEKREDVDRY